MQDNAWDFKVVVFFTSHVKTNEVANWQSGYHSLAKCRERQSHTSSTHMMNKQGDVNYHEESCSKT